MEKQEAKNNPIDKTNTVDAQAKIEMMKELKIAKSTTERVNLFGKVMDTYGVDALV